jgi:glutathione S-transferase
MKLYGFPLSSYTQKTLMGFFEKGQVPSLEIVDLRSPEGRAAYLQINALGKMPTLVLEDGYRVPESSIILEWADVHIEGGTRLFPADPDEARKARFHDRLADLYLNNPMQTLFFEGMKPEAERDAKAMKRAGETIDTMYGLLDAWMEKRTWQLGDTFSVADVSHAPALAYLRRVRPFDAHANIVRYAQRLLERPSFLEVMKIAAPFLAKMGG